LVFLPQGHEATKKNALVYFKEKNSSSLCAFVIKSPGNNKKEESICIPIHHAAVRISQTSLPIPKQRIKAFNQFLRALVAWWFRSSENLYLPLIRRKTMNQKYSLVTARHRSGDLRQIA